MVDDDYVQANRRYGRLKRRFDALVEEARRNERVHRRFQAVELLLLGAGDLPGIARLLARELCGRFELDAVSLALADPRGETAATLEGLLPDADAAVIRLLDDPGSVLRAGRLGEHPRLAAYAPDDHGWLFTTLPPGPGSVAVLPLRRQRRALGALVLFSRRSERYREGAGTEFLQRLAAVAGVCVENALNTARLRRLSLTDPLTGLSNRRDLEQRLIAELARARREGAPLSCLYVDVDWFKRVNDEHGHDVGDLALRHVASVMRGTLRRADVVARYGGEEFVALLPGAAGRRAVETAERLRRAVAASPLHTPGHPALSLTVSIGLASVEPAAGEGDPLETVAGQLLETADRALLAAKAAGRDRVVVAAPRD